LQGCLFVWISSWQPLNSLQSHKTYSNYKIINCIYQLTETLVNLNLFNFQNIWYNGSTTLNLHAFPKLQSVCFYLFTKCYYLGKNSLYSTIGVQSGVGSWKLLDFKDQWGGGEKRKRSEIISTFKQNQQTILYEKMEK